MKELLRFLAYSVVTVLTVAAPGHSLTAAALLVGLSRLQELSRRLADSLFWGLPFNLK